MTPVIAALREHDIAYTLAETQRPAHATELVREYLTLDERHVDAVLVVGGDGTVMEVASALAEFTDAPPIGIIAVGTANVLAGALGIPRNPSAAIRALATADVVTLDLGRISGGPAFAIGLGVGLDAAMIGGASPALKRRIGYAAYAWSALRAGLRLERFHARIIVDGTVLDVDTSSVLIANFGRVLGDRVCFGSGIEPQDGVLDVCVYSPVSLADATRVWWRMVFGGVSDDRCVRTIRGRHIRVETDVPRPIQADGELLGVTPVDVRVEPGALRVLVPRSLARPRHSRLTSLPAIRRERLERSIP